MTTSLVPASPPPASRLRQLKGVLAEPPPLADLLQILTRFGRPTVTLGGRGWFAWVEMSVSVKGGDFRISSEANHPAPLPAAVECAERILAALAEIGVQE